VLTNLKGLDDELYEKYISKNAKFYVETMLSHETTDVSLLIEFYLIGSYPFPAHKDSRYHRIAELVGF